MKMLNYLLLIASMSLAVLGIPLMSWVDRVFGIHRNIKHSDFLYRICNSEFRKCNSVFRKCNSVFRKCNSCIQEMQFLDLENEVSIFSKFHKDWAKIVDFLLGHSDFKITFLTKLRLYYANCVKTRVPGKRSTLNAVNF